MSFNVGNFIKSSSKSAVVRMVDNIVGSIVSGLPMNTTALASSISQSLIQSGSSYQTADTMASLKTDSIISGAADEFFALAGRQTNRLGGSTVSELRRLSSETLSSHLLNVQPETKINSKLYKDNYEVLSIV